MSDAEREAFLNPRAEDGTRMSPRVAALQDLELTPRRLEARRLAGAMRRIIDQLVSTSASVEELAAAADDLENLAEVFSALPSGQRYQGFSEAAVAGSAMGPGEGEATEVGASFDDSPFIGLANPMSPPMELSYRDERVVCDVTFGAAYEGPPGCVHGGYVAGAFDELLGAAQSLSGTQGMTARLEIDYRSPTPLHTPLRMEAWLEEHDGRKIWTRGRLEAGDRLCAEARGLFIAFDPELFRTLLAQRNDD